MFELLLSGEFVSLAVRAGVLSYWFVLFAILAILVRQALHYPPGSDLAWIYLGTGVFFIILEVVAVGVTKGLYGESLGSSLFFSRSSDGSRHYHATVGYISFLSLVVILGVASFGVFPLKYKGVLVGVTWRRHTDPTKLFGFSVVLRNVTLLAMYSMSAAFVAEAHAIALKEGSAFLREAGVATNLNMLLLVASVVGVASAAIGKPLLLYWMLRKENGIPVFGEQLHPDICALEVKQVEKWKNEALKRTSARRRGSVVIGQVEKFRDGV